MELGVVCYAQDKQTSNFQINVKTQVLLRTQWTQKIAQQSSTLLQFIPPPPRPPLLILPSASFTDIFV